MPVVIPGTCKPWYWDSEEKEPWSPRAVCMLAHVVGMFAQALGSVTDRPK
ncbi:hypothetical protein ACRRTK_023569 [Alexandromys fortis]